MDEQRSVLAVLLRGHYSGSSLHIAFCFVLRALFILLGLMFSTNLTIYSLFWHFSLASNVLPTIHPVLYMIHPSNLLLVRKNLHLQLTRI